jgi:hypothetical protein
LHLCFVRFLQQTNIRLNRLVKLQNMVMSPVGLGIKNDSAGEDQQQFTRPVRARPQ